MYVPDDGGREEGWVEVAIFTTGASLLRVYYDHHSKTLSLVHCTVDDIFTSYDERRSENGDRVRYRPPRQLQDGGDIGKTFYTTRRKTIQISEPFMPPLLSL